MFFCFCVYKKTICETDVTFTERLYEPGRYIGFWKNYKPHGKGFMYVTEENKVYGLTSNNGEIVDSEVLGFSSKELSEKEKQADELFKNYSNMGYINLEESEAAGIEALEDIDFFNK